MNIGAAGFYPNNFVYNRFPPKIQFFTVYLVHCLHKVSPVWTAKEKKFKLKSPDCQKIRFQHSF